MRDHEHARQGSFGRGLLALALTTGACNLEQALGVDDGGTTAGPSTQTDPGGPGGPGTGGPGGDPTGSVDTTGADPDTSGGQVPSMCQGQTLRVATFNVESIDPAGSQPFEALVDVVQRIDADVICMQEVQFYETRDLFALANAAGYPDVIQAQEAPAIGGDHTNACLSRPSLRLVGSYSGWDLSPDSNANDVGRDILVVQADLASEDQPPCRVGLVALHLKSGQVQADWFRRQIEAIRAVQAIEAYRAEYPGDPIVVLGDFNESIDDPALGSVFRAPPVDLPPSYQVGSDIQFPVTYEMFTTFMDAGFSVADATQEDTVDRDETWQDVVRLDYVMVSGAEIVADEVYNACRDNGFDDAPRGQWMPKAGDPLDCAVSDEASDHFPVMADLLLP